MDDKGAVGRSCADAPEIDGSVFLDNELSGSAQLKPGQIVRAVIDEADEYDLWATVI